MSLVLFALFIYHVGLKSTSGKELKKAVLIRKKEDLLLSEEVLLGYMPQCDNGTKTGEMEDRVKQLENEVLMLKRDATSKKSMENDRIATFNGNYWLALFLNSAHGSELFQMQSLLFGKDNLFLKLI